MHSVYSEYVYERGVEDFFDGVLPARSWEMPAECELPAKIGRCFKNLRGHNSDYREFFDIYFEHPLRGILL